MLSWLAAVILCASFIMATECLVKLRGDSTAEMYFLAFLAVTYAISFISMVVYTYRVTVSDPTDPTVALERSFKDCSTSFQTKDYSYYCDICDTHVLVDTKHCQMCNRCSYDFDHHCQWVSNDIGGRNYKDFIRMLISVMMTLLA